LKVYKVGRGESKKTKDKSKKVRTMKIERFEDIISWQKSKELSVSIYKILKNDTDFGFRNQIERASVSIMNNIAEGFERQTNNEFKQFLYIAKGSCGEVRSMLFLAKELDKISIENFKKLYSLSIEISKLLSGLIKSL
jgi:four helix bundle protein